VYEFAYLECIVGGGDAALQRECVGYNLNTASKGGCWTASFHRAGSEA